MSRGHVALRERAPGRGSASGRCAATPARLHACHQRSEPAGSARGALPGRTALPSRHVTAWAPRTATPTAPHPRQWTETWRPWNCAESRGGRSRGAAKQPCLMPQAFRRLGGGLARCHASGESKSAANTLGNGPGGWSPGARPPAGRHTVVTRGIAAGRTPFARRRLATRGGRRSPAPAPGGTCRCHDPTGGGGAPPPAACVQSRRQLSHEFTKHE